MKRKTRVGLVTSGGVRYRVVAAIRGVEKPVPLLGGIHLLQ